ncbi:hypothetical protein ATY30_00915 [Sinorhizobium americanum]|nr:hypothetical protein CO664_25735 [Sinorhizobium sp. NG07B]POH33914.1 hypothetical protein ATY30_00915 [Sinorhizobium americanum]
MLKLNQKCTFDTLSFGTPKNQGFERHGLRLQDIRGKFQRLSMQLRSSTTIFEKKPGKTPPPLAEAKEQPACTRRRN